MSADRTFGGVCHEPTCAFDDEPTLPTMPPTFEDDSYAHANSDASIPVSVDLSSLESEHCDPANAIEEVVLRRAQAMRDAFALRKDGSGPTHGTRSLRRW